MSDEYVSLTYDEEILILDALAMAYEVCEWTHGAKQQDFWNLYQKLAPTIIKEEECDT